MADAAAASASRAVLRRCAEGAVAISSTIVPQDSHEGHFPAHRGVRPPQAVQRYCVRDFMVWYRWRAPKLPIFPPGRPSLHLCPTAAALSDEDPMTTTTIDRPYHQRIHRRSVLPADVAKAYEFCRKLTYTHARTFYFASHFLASDKRKACYAVYAFCRYVDDIVDVAVERGDMTTDAAVALVEQWRKALSDLYDGKSVVMSNGDDATPILQAWDHTLGTFLIPRHLPEELIEGVLMDTVVSRFETFDDLWNYCYKVASVVGLMTSEIFRYSSPEALTHAVDLGIAMQLTNIIRDVKEDASKGRIYLPLQELGEYGITEDDILNHRWSPALRDYIQFNVDRAERYYVSADSGIPMLERDSRVTVHLMSMNYRKILRRVEAMDYNVFLGRASTSLFDKLCSVPRAYIKARQST